MATCVFSPPQSLDSFEVTLGNHPSSVPLARRFLREWYGHWGLSDSIVEAGELVASELITNGLKAQAGGVKVRFRWSPPAAYVEVWDADPTPPVPQTPELIALGGRGLILVEAYASRWGHYPSDGGKVVWAEFIWKVAGGVTS
ncbi:ATP-binding protein [Actinomadura decatromicini]|uniref:ATP-binding protein n=1 Tax=Actinomadura decatromicini TaxID=2604572 RepID=UPI0016533B14|nr:ATP-binding protein [Actinomadura decatromicini]